MQRIDHESADPDINGPDRPGFTGGDPEGLIAPTVVTAKWLNGVQEEVASVIESAMPLAPYPQLLAALAFPLGLLSAATMRKIINGPCGLGAAANATRGERTLWFTDSSANIRNYAGVVQDIGTTNDIYAMVYLESADAFVAVGQNGEIQRATAANVWTHQTQAGGYAGWFRGLAVGPGLFIAVGDENEIQTSPDGITWTKRVSALPNTTELQQVVYSASARRYLIRGDVDPEDILPRSDVLQWSSDGITWATTAVPLPSGRVQNMGASPQGFIVINDLEFGESADGVTWSTGTIDSTFEPNIISEQGWLIERPSVAGFYPRVALSPHHAPFAIAPQTPTASALNHIVRTANFWICTNLEGDIYLSQGMPF